MRPARGASAALLTLAFMVSACGGGGGGNKTVPAPVATATPTPTPAPTATLNPLAFTCPTSDQAAASSRAGLQGSEVSGQAARRAVARPSLAKPVTPTTTLLAVTYNRTFASNSTATIAAREQALGANLVRSFDYPKLNNTMRVVAVPTSSVAQAQSSLRAQQGVQSVAVTGAKRYLTGITKPFFPNDPYFNGFTVLQNQAAANPSAANPAASTYQVPAYEESALVPGQWDMHAIGLDYAFAYSQANNGSLVPANPLALGSAAVNIAIVDSGEDPNHPELAGGKLALQRCFITNESGVQSMGNFSTDPLGHGTDVTGIAAAVTGNNLGFAGAGGGSSVLAYRVFPTPDDTCVSENGDAQCDASTVDIASAIDDAVTNHANVISLSLGGDGCTNGVDNDPTEQTAITNALTNNVIVVAASGNSAPGTSGVTAPACDNGVIAVGASALDDGQPNSSNHTGGTATNPVEYVASYSQFGSPASAPKSASAWGIVAPGGDPSGASSDADELHWIENIWTTTPYQSNSSDTNFEALTCGPDYPGTGAIADCRTLIAGTSMATPHVAGAVALILAVNPGMYGTPTAMKTLLCTTADDIGDPHEGCGRLNVYRAMAHALNDPAPP